MPDERIQERVPADAGHHNDTSGIADDAEAQVPVRI
jgi:hypothetical protein